MAKQFCIKISTKNRRAPAKIFTKGKGLIPINHCKMVSLRHYAVALFFVIVFLICVLLQKRKGRKVNFPPGPFQWPFFGNLLQFRMAPLDAMMKWKKQYGKIVGLKLGSYPTVLLSDAEILKEAFRNEAFNGRASLIPMMVFSGGFDHGTLTSTSHSHWQAVRNFTIKALNEVGFGRKSREHLLIENVNTFVNFLKKSSHNVILRDALMLPVTRYVWEVLAGQQLNGSETRTLRDAILDFQNKFFLPIGSAFWMTRKFVEYFPSWSGYSDADKSAKILHRMIGIGVTEAKHELLDFENFKVSKVDETKGPKSFIEAWLLEIQKNAGNPDSPFYGEMGENNMRGTVMNICSTGVFSLVNSLNWAFAIVAARRDVQQKLVAEIKEIMGETCARTIALSDMNKMPYTMAFMKEVFRFSTSAPFANFHQTATDVQFHGYQIPAGTVVIGNLYEANHDAEIWVDPERFRPERFLVDSNPPNSLSFSVGLRTCPGQTYVRSSFFLLLVTILQNFDVSFDSSAGDPRDIDITEQALTSVFRFAKPYSFVLQSRD